LKVFADEHPSQIYIVTEWFDGRPLRQILAGKELSRERAVHIVLYICNALAYTQNHGIVHRDLRPENILVDSQDHIKLINFGVAAKTGARRITFTNLAQVVGISEYISPEELNGKRDDARSDIYALGVILYEMLTGKTPFQGQSPYDRLLKHPIPPREIDATISPQLQEVIYRAIERDPRNRYPNAHEFALDLGDLKRVGVANRPELRDWKNRSAPPWRKVLLFTAIALLPIVIFGLLFYFASR
jgi:serine/threonine-protein kinase